MITKTYHKTPQARKPQGQSRMISAGTNITSGVRNRSAVKKPVMSSSWAKLTPAQRAFARQLQINSRKQSSVMAATNTSNIAARPDFLELLPLFVQKLLVLDVYGSVAMKSRQELIPYFKVKAENTKGETRKGDIFNTPFVNRQGIDPNFTGRIVKNEAVDSATLAYVPVLPGSVTLTIDVAGTVTTAVDDGTGAFVDPTGAAIADLTIDYSTGLVDGLDSSASVAATYQYDNETIGPDADGAYGAKMGKIDLQLDEINLIATAHELSCYYSVYAAFAAQQEYGANIADLAKDAAFGEITAEINTAAFKKLADAAAYKPQFDWDASPVLSGAVVPSDYLNMFKLKLNQASASIYQATRLARPNKLIVGSNVNSFMQMIDGFNSENIDETVGPYKSGTLEGFDVYMDPNYDPNKWVMAAKSNDIRRNSALFGEYMPVTATNPIGLADLSVQSGYATMYAMEVVNPLTIVSGKILGTF